MALEGTVKVPGIGPVKKQTAVYGGAAAVVLVLVIWWARQRKASQAAASSSPAASTAAGQQTDPAGNTGSIDPATGYVYGSPEDQQDLAATQGGTAAYDTSSLGGGGGLSGYYYGTGGSAAPTAPGPGNFADNAEWAQYVEAYMIGTLNADPATVGNAVGKYLTGQPLDPTQQNIVHEAIAFGQQPPQSGSGGYPPGIRTTTGGAGGGGGKGNATVPKVTGDTAGTAHNKIDAAGLTPIADPQQQPHWVVTSTSPKGGASVPKGTRVLITAHAPAPAKPKPKPPRKEPT